MPASTFRGACVEDLQLSPALVLPWNTTVSTALMMAFERDFSILPLSSPTSRRLAGWVSIASLKALHDSGKIENDAQVGDSAVREGGAVKGFERTKTYTVITPDTPLEELESFFVEGAKRGVTFALVTDAERKFVLGLCTKEDLEKFVERRYPSSKTETAP